VRRGLQEVYLEIALKLEPLGLAFPLLKV